MELDFVLAVRLHVATFIASTSSARVAAAHTPLMSLLTPSRRLLLSARSSYRRAADDIEHGAGGHRRFCVHTNMSAASSLPTECSRVKKREPGNAVETLIQLIYLIRPGVHPVLRMSDRAARHGVFAGVAQWRSQSSGPCSAANPGVSLDCHCPCAGTAVGVPLSWVPLTAVPQRTALSHAFGGLAAGLVGTAKYYMWLGDGGLTKFRMTAIGFEVLLGYLTCTGSLMAAGKLQEVIPTRPLTYRNQNVINLGLLALAVIIAVTLVFRPELSCCFQPSSGFHAVRRAVVLPIGGADMPTVISCSMPMRASPRLRWAS